MAFAVFGMTEVAARQIALRCNNRRMIDTGEKDEEGKPVRRKETPEEFEKRMNERVVTGILEYKPIMVSKEFDAPQFAHDFISICIRGGQQHSRLHVRYMNKELGKFIEYQQ